MINIDALNDDEKLAALESIHKSIAESKEIQKKKITTNVELIVKALKKIESDLKQRYDETGQLIANLKNGEDGRDGKDGKDGKNGRDGRDGPVGPRGYDGLPGRNGIDGTDGVSVTDAHIDFDGSLIISLSSGRVINVGEVVAADIAEKIKVITNGGGTSQGVLDAIASLQAQISAIVSGLSYKGTWNASTNTPTLTSSVGTAGFYYIVSVAGSTNLNGITDWQVGDWAVFSGTVWQKLDQTNLVTSVAGRTGAVVLSNTDISGLGTMSTQAANNVSITGGSITGITDLAIADGGTGASTAANARTNLGASTVGANVFTLTNPSAITFPRFNADNTVSALDAATFRTAIGAGTSSTTGTVTSVAASVPTFLSIGGSPITSSGTLAITLSGTALPTTSGGTGLTSFTANGVVYASSTSALTTGSSLTFDGSTFISKSNAEFGNSLVDANRFVNVIGAGTNRDFGIQFTGSRVLWQNTGQSGLLFGVSDAEQMRLTSTGLGIGTSSFTDKLAVNLSGANSAYFGNNTSGTTSNTVKIHLAPTNAFGTNWSTYEPAYIGAVNNSGGSDTNLVFATYNAGVTSEKMRLDTSGNLGIGTSSPANKLVVSNAGAQGFEFDPTNGILQVYNRSTSAYGEFRPYGSLIRWFTGTSPTEKMRLDSSGNLGIGTSSPSSKLQLTGASQAATSLTMLYSAIQAGSIGINSSGSMVFGLDGSTGTTTRLNLDTSGNLGLGVTPSASVWKSFEIGANGSSITSAGSNDIRLFSNAFWNGSSYRYVNTAASGSYVINTGAHYWLTAASGTAGNAITFTQAMTLDADGDLGIGVTSPAVRLDVSGGSSADVISIRGRTSDNFGLLSFATSAGVKNSYIGSNDSTFLTFYTNGFTERARIDSSGNLLVGTTSSSPAGTVAQFVNKWSGGAKWGISLDQTVSSSTQYTHINFSTNGTTVGYINANNSVTTYNSVSDYRLKTVIGAVSGSGERIDALEPIEYEWKTDGSRTRGFLAHKFQEVYANSVSGTKDAVDEQGNPIYQAMQAGSAEVIADLVAEIQSLRKRLADAGI